MTMTSASARLPEIVPGRRMAGRVLAVLSTPDPSASFATAPVEALTLTHEGIPGERHQGFLRGADARTPWYPRGTPIHNTRQVSLLAPDELAAIAGAFGLPAIEAGWLGGNILVEGLPQFSLLPRGTRLFFPGEAVIAIEGQNAPCRFAGEAVRAAAGGESSMALRFVAAAKRLRGLVGFVERPGTVRAGDTVSAMIPEQWLYRPDTLL